MAKKSAVLNESSEQKPKRNRKPQPVTIVVASVPEGSELTVGQVISDESVHDMASAARFITKAELDGKFDVVKHLGTIEVKAEVKRKVTVG
jgi:hypothetical protein